MANLYRARKRGSGGIQVDSLTITTMPTKTTYSVGDSLDLTGLVVTASAGSLSGTVTNECTFSPADGSILSEEGTITINVSYLGTTTSFNVTCNAATSWLESSTWAEVNDAVKNGTFAQHASVGDTKSFIVNNKTYNAEVVSINDGTGDASQWYPDRTVDFICTELYETSYRYNSTDTNAGGFPSSEIKNTLNNTIYPLLPTDLKAVIIDKSHSYESGSLINYFWVPQMTVLATKLWLPTFYEIFGFTDNAIPDETALNNKAYTLTSRKKIKNGDISPNYWWLSTQVDNGTTFLAISEKGQKSGLGAGYTWGVPICFRIGASPSTIPEWSTATDQ